MSLITPQFTPRLTRRSLASAELVPVAGIVSQKVLFATVRNSRGLAWDSVTSTQLPISPALRPGELCEHPVADTLLKHFPHRIQRQVAPRWVGSRAAASSNPGMQSVCIVSP